MEKYSLLLSYFDKQLVFVQKMHAEIAAEDIAEDDKKYKFALQVQQFYTALEDLFKQIAKAFENHIEDMSQFHKEILLRMNLDVPKIRPAVISNQSFLFLDKFRAFRHFVRHAYDCELEESQLEVLQQKLKTEYQILERDLQEFRLFIQKLSNA